MSEEMGGAMTKIVGHAVAKTIIYDMTPKLISYCSLYKTYFSASNSKQIISVFIKPFLAYLTKIPYFCK